jgi:hypothetical protein
MQLGSWDLIYLYSYLTINWEIYVCLSVCLSVCVSVCVCVCPAIRFHISQRIFSKFAGNILWVRTRIVGYLLFSARNARACILNARMCAFAYFRTDSLQICWEHTTTHHKCQGLRTVHFHAPCARVVKTYTSIWTDLFSNLLGTYKYMGYIIIMFTHHVHARVCERLHARVCERARDKLFAYLWTVSFKFAVNKHHNKYTHHNK